MRRLLILLVLLVPGLAFGQARWPADKVYFDDGEELQEKYDDAKLSAGFDACRTGAIQGWGYDATSGLWDSTCGNFDWHGAEDAGQATASYYVDCTAAGDPHGACRRSGERLLIGAVHRVGMAAARTVAGGTVYLPRFDGYDAGIYIDDGCGTLSDGSTRAECPPAFERDFRSLSHFSSSGPSVRGDRIQANRGVRIVGEGNPTVNVDANGAQIRVGSWLVADTDQSSGTPSSGYGGETLDGPDEDLPRREFRFITGGQRSGAYCVNSGDNADISCETKGIAATYKQWSGETNWIIGGNSEIHQNASQSTGSLCIDNFVGTNQQSTTGTCRGDRRIRCWDATADQTRENGGCNFTGVGGGTNLGPCEGFVDALDYERNTRNGDDPDVRLIVNVGQCVENPTAAEDCHSDMGHASFITGIQAISGSCGTTGKTVWIGTDPAAVGVPPWFRGYIVGGSGVNQIFATRASVYNQQGGGYYNVGFDVANHAYQVHTGDPIVTGLVTSSSGDVTTLALSTGNLGANDYSGYTAIIDAAGSNNGPIYRAIASNDATNITLALSTDSGSSTNAAEVTADDTVGIYGSLCTASFRNDQQSYDDETACDHVYLTAPTAGANTGYYGGVWLNCSAPGGGPSCMDSNSLSIGTSRYWDGSILLGRRGFISDTSGDYVRNFTVLNTDGTTIFSSFSSGARYENIRVLNSRFASILQTSQNIYGLIVDGLTAIGNRGNGGAAIALNSGQDISLRNIALYEGRSSVPIVIRPAKMGTDTYTTLRNITIDGLVAVQDTGEGFGTNKPTAAIWIDSDNDAATANRINGLSVRNVVVRSTDADVCGIWLEENDAADELEESRPSWTFENWTIDSTGSGTSKPVCVGDTDDGGDDDAATTTDIFAEQYIPRMVNLRGGATGGETAYPDWDWSSMAAAEAPDCDNAPEGLRLAIHDDDGTCADTDGVLTGGGATTTVCNCTGGDWVITSTGGAHANGANCAAGEIPLGVDGSGAVEGCYEPTEADIADLSHTTDTSANTVCSGTTTYMDGEGGCDDLSTVYAGIAGTTSSSFAVNSDGDPAEAGAIRLENAEKIGWETSPAGTSEVSVSVSAAETVTVDNTVDGIALTTTTARECIVLEGGAITCDDATGCTTATRNNTNFSQLVATFSDSDGEDGFWSFELPDNLTGSDIYVRYSWESDSLVVTTNDDLCMAVQAVSVASGEAWETASFGTAVGEMDTGGDTDDGDLLQSDEFTVTPTGLGAGERLIVRLYRDNDATPTGCDNDNISNNVDIYALRVCYEVDNVFSGE